ncbi:calpain, putative [Plasmodium malariae]|uniref:Calpain, putative n=1 Tax=Plasmodium malariae TaxID=5858 RepID=A0A1C3KZ55_PLAMA|nr:calpain, putative [Plasmodium malariae]
MGCKFSKLKVKKRKDDKIKSGKIQSSVNNDILKIYDTEEGIPKTCNNIEDTFCKNEVNEVTNKSPLVRWRNNSNKEHIKNSSGISFSEVNYKTKELKKERRRHAEMDNEQKEEIRREKKNKNKLLLFKVSDDEEFEGKINQECKTKCTGIKNDVRDKGEKKNVNENKLENNSFKGIINTINYTFLRKKIRNGDKTKASDSLSKLERRAILQEKKIKFIYKGKKEKCVNENDAALKDRPNSVLPKKREEMVTSAMRKNRELLLYYHDFRSMTLKQNSFLHIYEFYRYNCNMFNLFSIMPSHIRGNVHASKILFESSLIGKYIILPWIDNDPDIKNNLYLKYVQNFAENNKKNIERDDGSTRNKEVNFCGLFHNNYNKDTQNRKKLEKGNLKNENYLFNDKAIYVARKRKEKGDKKKKKEKSEEKEQDRMKGASKSKNKKKRKRKKYVNSRNLSMDNLYNIYLKKRSAYSRKLQNNKKAVVSVKNKEVKKKNYIRKDSQNKKGNENNKQFTRDIVIEELKILQNKKSDKNYKINLRSSTISFGEDDTMLRKRKKEDKKNTKEQMEKRHSINKYKKKELPENIHNGTWNRNNVNITQNGENEKLEKKKKSCNKNVSNNNMNNAKNYYVSHVQHTEKNEFCIGKDIKKNKIEDIKIVIAKKNKHNSPHSKEIDISVTPINTNLESRVYDEKTVGSKCNMEKYNVEKEEMEERDYKTKTMYEKKNYKRDYKRREVNEIRSKPKDEIRSKMNDERNCSSTCAKIVNSNHSSKVVKKVKKKVYCHEIPHPQDYSEMGKRCKNVSSKKFDDLNLYSLHSNGNNNNNNNMINNNINNNINNDINNNINNDINNNINNYINNVNNINNIKNYSNDNVRQGNSGKIGNRKLGGREYSGGGIEEKCNHKYRLNEKYIKKNYILCKKCHKRRCIFHYVNGFKLYGWVNYKWTDPDGFLELSVRQQKKFDSWKRLSDLYNNPIVMSTDLYNNCIRQGFVADCSFLSSLTVLIEYEKKHKVPVLSSIISPCTSNLLHVNKTWPIFNPSGMYICRLHCNGIQRKIIIDDYVPVKNNNALLVAYSNNKEELWVTLLEKAFVKLMGGSYSMFGSNPGSDLYYLTGWIPVTISLKSKLSSSPPSLDHLTVHSSPNSDSGMRKHKFNIKDEKQRKDTNVDQRNHKLYKHLTYCMKNKSEEDGIVSKMNKEKGKKEIFKNRKKIKKNVSKLFLKGVLNNNSRNTYNTRNESYSNDLNLSFRDSVKFVANLNIHRLNRNANCSYFRDTFLKYKKLKIYWIFKIMYITHKENRKNDNMKMCSFMKGKKSKYFLKGLLCNNDDMTYLNGLKKNGLVINRLVKNRQMKNNQTEYNFVRNNLEKRNSSETYFGNLNNKDNLLGTSKISSTIPNYMKDNMIKVNLGRNFLGEQKSKIFRKEERDYEMKQKHGKKFQSEEVSNMDLSGYICGSADQYSYMNKRGDSSILTEENEEYDEKWDVIWNNMYEGIKKGKCVVCLGTLELKDAAPSGLDYPEGVSISTGIVTRHAYSILNIDSYNGDKLLYIKNPWGCVRWKGKYSHNDDATWTKEVQRKLNYSIEKAKGKDDGCFWIPWKVVVKYFSHIYICWNSVIFPYQFEIHTKWENSSFLINSILLDDTHLVAYNPQFALHVDVRKQDLSEDGMYYIGKKPIEVWILLSRHVRERKTDVSQKYLALHIHAGKDRIICPLFPIKQGIYSNGECTFTKLVIGGEDKESNVDHDIKMGNSKGDVITASNKGENSGGIILNSSIDSEQEIMRNIDFVLIVSQYSQKEEFNFTLKVFSHTHLSIYELPPLLSDNFESLYFKGQWTSECAGGCSNNLWSYFRNPHIRFYVPEDSSFCIFLECSQEYSVNLRIFKGMTSSPRKLKKGEIISSGAYKSGCCYIECTLESGIYCLIPSLYRANITGDYQLCIHYPKFKQKPILYFIPYSYIIPPFSFFKYELVHLYSLKSYSVILFHTISITLLSLRITFFQNMDIKGIPFVNIYKLVSTTDSLANDLECGNIIKNNSFNSLISFNRFMYKIVQKCNIHGGPGNDILPLSTCAYDYYIKFNSILIPLVELENDRTSYLLLITTNIKEDILYNHEVHFVSDKSIFIDKCYPVHS